MKLPGHCTQFAGTSLGESRGKGGGSNPPDPGARIRCCRCSLPGLTGFTAYRRGRTGPSHHYLQAARQRKLSAECRKPLIYRARSLLQTLIKCNYALPPGLIRRRLHYSSKKKRCSPKAGLRSDNQVACSSYLAKNGRCTQSGFRPWINRHTNTFSPAISVTP